MIFDYNFVYPFISTVRLSFEQPHNFGYLTFYVLISTFQNRCGLKEASHELQQRVLVIVKARRSVTTPVVCESLGVCAHNVEERMRAMERGHPRALLELLFFHATTRISVKIYAFIFYFYFWTRKSAYTEPFVIKL